jgi:RNA polymerase sigma-70 factor (ECF subfamily)
MVAGIYGSPVNRKSDQRVGRAQRGASVYRDEGCEGDDDKLLASRAADGDVAAYEVLYRKHVGRIHALCLRMVGDPGRAEDLTQDVFVRAFERLGSFRGESAFATWLYRVAINLVIESLRAQGRWKQRFESELESDSDSRQLIARQAAAGSSLDLERAISSLPERARLVFILHDVEGYKHREIADLIGIAVGTSKAHLHRAREQLRRELR